MTTRHGILPLLSLALIGALLPIRAGALAQPAEPTPLLGAPTVVTPLTAGPTAPADPPPPSPTGPTGAAPTAATRPTTTATSGPDPLGPDGCEPNPDAARACALPLDQVSGPFTFAPEPDADWYALTIPADPALVTQITAHATAGLDLVLTARQGPQILATGTLSLTLTAPISGVVQLHLENRAPGLARGETYRLEVRRQLVPPAPQPDGPAPDAWENNWSAETATPLAVGQVADLSFVCPEARPGACAGGDHDYLRVPVKAGVAYLIATFDLGPGMDPVLEVFWGAGGARRVVAANDDYGPGGLLAALTWVAPGDGMAIVRVAPRNGALPLPTTGERAGAYRLVVTPAASELAATLRPRLAEQADLPTATPTAAPTTSSAGGTSGGAAGGVVGPAPTAETIPTGAAFTLRATALRRAPAEAAPLITTLPAGAVLEVRGPVVGLWVSVASSTILLPGWVLGTDLQRWPADHPTPTPAVTLPLAAVTPLPTSPAPASGGPAPSPTPRAGGAPATPSAPAPAVTAPPAPPPARVQATLLDPELPPAPPAPPIRAAVALTVWVGRGASIPDPRPTPEPGRLTPVAGVRVQLVDSLGAVISEARTDAGGQLTLRGERWPGDALWVQLPALGLTIPLAEAQATLTIQLPPEAV